MSDKWMQAEGEREKAAGTKGSLRKALHVKSGEKIPAKKLAKPEHSRSPKMRKKANMAKAFKKASGK